MKNRNRRELFADTAKGMLLAGLGLSVSQDLGLAPLWAGEKPARLTFGNREPLVDFLAQTPSWKIVVGCLDKMHAGTSPHDLVSAAALANARIFGGEDYGGFHTHPYPDGLGPWHGRWHRKRVATHDLHCPL